MAKMRGEAASNEDPQVRPVLHKQMQSGASAYETPAYPTNGTRSIRTSRRSQLRLLAASGILSAPPRTKRP
jgi:hypothetical protein